MRVDLNGRRVRGWVVADDVEAPEGVSRQGPGPPHRRGAAARAGRAVRVGGVAVGRAAAHLPGGGLAPRVGSPPCPAAPGPRPSGVTVPPGPTAERALAGERVVLRLPPAADRYSLVVAALGATPPDRDALVLCPSVAQARDLARRLRRVRPAGGVRGPRPAGHGGRGGVGPRRGRRVHGGRGPGRGLGPGAPPGPGGRPRRARRGLPGGGLAHLARPGRGGRAGPAGRRAGAAGVAVPHPRGPGVGHAWSPRGGPRSGGAGRRSTSSTAARRTRRPACSPSPWPRCCARAAGWCASSTARDGRGCRPAPPAGRSWPAPSAPGP